MQYTLIQTLIDYVAKYQESNSSNKLEDFTIWLNTNLFGDDLKKRQAVHHDLLIEFKVMHLYKELKRQTKKVLSNSPVTSIDEYSFLLHLKHQESYRKMELIQLHNLEAPTGIEIIKRLLKSRLIIEFPDEQDRRAKRIKITPDGVNLIKQIEPEINIIFNSFNSPLSLNEQIQLSGMLDKLIHSKA